MENTIKDKNNNTVFNHVKNKINKSGDAAYSLTTGKKIMLFWSYLGVAYYIMITYIAPKLLKELFLIADFGSMFIFYGIVVVIAFIIGIVYNFVVKILLYLFS